MDRSARMPIAPANELQVIRSDNRAQQSARTVAGEHVISFRTGNDVTRNNSPRRLTNWLTTRRRPVSDKLAAGLDVVEPVHSYACHCRCSTRSARSSAAGVAQSQIRIRWPRRRRACVKASQNHKDSPHTARRRTYDAFRRLTYRANRRRSGECRPGNWNRYQFGRRNVHSHKQSADGDVQTPRREPLDLASIDLHVASRYE